MADGYELTTEWYYRYDMQSRMIEKIKEGWKVLYTLHLHQPPPQTSWQYNSGNNAPTCTSVMNPDGSVSSSVFIPLHTPAPGSQAAEPQIEVMYYRKNWEKDPCPRCSFPYPNPEDISREA